MGLTLTSVLGMLSYFDFLDLLPKGSTISNTIFTSNVNLKMMDVLVNGTRYTSLGQEMLGKSVVMLA